MRIEDVSLLKGDIVGCRLRQHKNYILVSSWQWKAGWADRIKALAPYAPLDSWALLLDPAWAKKIAPCGIVLMDSAIDVIPSVLRYLGRSPDASAPDDLDAALKALMALMALMAIRPSIRDFANGGALAALATGQACVALDYSGDVDQAGVRAKEAGKGVGLTFVAPKEGAEIGFDRLAIPSDAPHKEEAFAFIDFVPRPDIMARITDPTRYPNAVPATRLVKPGDDDERTAPLASRPNHRLLRRSVFGGKFRR